ncbi:MAG: hypothetical protein WKF89_16525, partial [Chitinophagaceae bacterium]
MGPQLGTSCPPGKSTLAVIFSECPSEHLRQELKVASTGASVSGLWLIRFQLIQSPEIDRYQFADTRFLHGNTVDDIDAAHGHFIMCYDDELALIAELPDHVC